MTIVRAAPPEADLCIVGAGPAGLALARGFIDTGIRVVVLESGGLEPDRSVQALSASVADSSHHAVGAASHGRRRQVGGTANDWLYDTRPSTGRAYARCVAPRAARLRAQIR
ncbi:MAG: FAD-dependent monooxygenase [Candidatus Limnocylindrales bacterium]